PSAASGRGSSPPPQTPPSGGRPSHTRRRTRAAARRPDGRPRSGWSPAFRRRAARRIHGASCAPTIPAETDRRLGSSSRRLPLAPELAEQVAHLGALERLAAVGPLVH